MLGTFVCNTCTSGEHLVLHRDGQKVNVRDLVPQAFVLADQNFLPAVPVGEDGGDCLKIFRLENCTLSDLVGAFLDATRGYSLPAGSVVVLTSACHLAAVGTAAYVSDFVAARLRLLAAFSGSIEVIHGVPVLSSGCTDRALIRGFRDTSQWLTLVFGSGRDISRTRDTFLANTLEVAAVSGSPMAPDYGAGSSMTPAADKKKFFSPDPIVYLLPADLDGKEKNQTFKSSEQLLPNVILPVPHDVQTEIITTLIGELNEKFSTELASPVSQEDLDMPFDYVEACAGKRFIIIGASHASRLANALEDLELCVVDLSSPGWKLNSDSASNTAGQLEEILAEDNELQNVIVYLMFDNKSYIGINNSGSRREAEKSSVDGKYHIIGDLSIVDRAEFKPIFNLAVPLLRAGGNHQKIIVSPLLRYSSGRCCGDLDHISNFGREGYYTSLGEKLADIRAWIREFSHGKRIKNCKVLCPNRLLEGGGGGDVSRRLASYWRDDPVHLNSEGYQFLTMSFLEVVSGLPPPDAGTGSGTDTGTHARGGRPSRGRGARSALSWVASDDAIAHRADNVKGRGRGRGTGGHRGGRPYSRGWRGPSWKRGWTGKPRGYKPY
jgi:hypothetical protein